ncbi:MAG: Fic family protein [Patulibacter sp.]|nr:Fic family protein [Patulibacter sp.]
MLFSTPTPDDALAERLGRLDRLRDQLALHARGADRFAVRLRREWRAAAAQSSIRIEGFEVSDDEARAAVDDQLPADGDAARAALTAYLQAMHHVTVLARDPRFRWNERVIQDLHFDLAAFDRDTNPGIYRTEGIAVTAPEGGSPAYVGPDADDVRGLIEELVAWLADGDRDVHVSVRAAMAHLHLVSIHPFRDGNGRISRVLQSLVLALGGPLAAEFVSIEEYLGRHTDRYYATLREVQAGSYRPERDAMPWVRLCVEAQIVQIERRLDDIARASRRWSALETLVDERSWPERIAVALQSALLGGVDRSGYAAEARVSTATASNDFRRAVDAGLLAPVGHGRSTRYEATDALRHRVGDANVTAPAPPSG